MLIRVSTSLITLIALHGLLALKLYQNGALAAGEFFGESGQVCACMASITAKIVRPVVRPPVPRVQNDALKPFWEYLSLHSLVL